MNRLKFGLLFLFMSAILLTSCDDELDVNAPFEDVAVVYCLLDGDSTRHYIKINQLYQTANGVDAETAAGDRNAQEYDNIQGYLVQLNDDGSENDNERFVLQSTESIPKEDGLFFNPDQTVYYVDARLDVTRDYKLFFTKPNGEEVSGTTKLVRKSDIPLAGTGGFRVNGIPFVGVDGEVLENAKFEIVSPINARIVEFQMKFKYVEYYGDGTQSTPFTVDIPVGNYTFDIVREDEQQESTLEVFFNPIVFYTAVGNAVPPITGNESPAIIRRQPLDSAIVIELSFADDELNTFIEVTRPSTSLLEDKPPYTNITNGIGVMASRTRWSDGFFLSTPSYDELATGLDAQLTGGRGFCNPRRPLGDPVGTGCF